MELLRHGILLCHMKSSPGAGSGAKIAFRDSFPSSGKVDTIFFFFFCWRVVDLVVMVFVVTLEARSLITAPMYRCGLVRKPLDPRFSLFEWTQTQLNAFLKF